MTSTPAARAFLIFTAAIIGTAVLVMVLLFGTKDNTQAVKVQSQENGRDLADTKSILRVVLAVTGCTVDDTAEACASKVKKAGDAQLAEFECRIRRAIDHLPALPPGTFCLPLPTSPPTSLPKATK